MANGNSNIIVFPSTPITDAIHLTPEDTGTDGIEAYANIAVKLGYHEDWHMNVPLHVSVSVDEDTGQPVLKFRKLSDESNEEHIFRYYDDVTKVWSLHCNADKKSHDAKFNYYNIILCIMYKQDISSGPEGITLTAEDTGTEGVDVLIIHGECYGDQGECFGGQIEWYNTEVVRAVVRKDFVTGLPNLYYSSESRLPSLQGTTMTHKKRGYEVATKTWWRYAEEVDPGVYREHCLRILKRL
jgi:hypothetical protein